MIVDLSVNQIDCGCSSFSILSWYLSLSHLCRLRQNTSVLILGGLDGSIFDRGDLVLDHGGHWVAEAFVGGFGLFLDDFVVLNWSLWLGVLGGISNNGGVSLDSGLIHWDLDLLFLLLWCSWGGLGGIALLSILSIGFLSSVGSLGGSGFGSFSGWLWLC